MSLFIMPSFPHHFFSHRECLILVSASILPSMITIGSNLFSMYQVRKMSGKMSNHISDCRRRLEDTRRILLIITVECLFAIVNAWFSDVILSMVLCKKLLADDDCPRFLQETYHFLVIFDLFNSLSNILLHSISSHHFRRELLSMFRSLLRSLKRRLCAKYHCYLFAKTSVPQSDHHVYYRSAISSHRDNIDLELSEVFWTIQTEDQSHKFSFLSIFQSIERLFSLFLRRNPMTPPRSV